MVRSEYFTEHPYTNHLYLTPERPKPSSGFFEQSSLTTPEVVPLTCHDVCTARMDWIPQGQQGNISPLSCLCHGVSLQQWDTKTNDKPIQNLLELLPSLGEWDLSVCLPCGTVTAPNGMCSQAETKQLQTPCWPQHFARFLSTDFYLPNPSKLELSEGRHCWILPHGHSTVLVLGQGILSHGAGVAALWAFCTLTNSRQVRTLRVWWGKAWNLQSPRCIWHVRWKCSLTLHSKFY